ncbi:MAG: hypothetical protein M1483_04460 [Actinobacteria bacterium]|nr:hypothetical protein [Actinomycetota bacterium]
MKPSQLQSKHIQVAFGCLWLLDGALQFQPQMLTKKFAAEIIGNNTMGRANIIKSSIHFLALVVTAHPVIFDVTFGVIQLTIGICLLFSALSTAKYLLKPALGASFFWSLVVWTVGEGLGGLMIPQSSMLQGAPGAAFVYGILSLALWPATNPVTSSKPQLAKRNTIAANGFIGETGVKIAWVFIWVSTALLELQIGNHAPGAISAQIKGEATGEPYPIAAFDRWLAHTTASHGMLIALVLMIVQVLIGIWILRPFTYKATLVAGMIVSIIYWIAGQNFGGMFTGFGTDPNLGPSMLLLALLMWPLTT